MNDDMNFAAWMVAGGRRGLDPSEARNRMHSRALATGDSLWGSLRERLVTRVATVRPAVTRLAGANGSQLDTVCCPA